MKKNKVLVASAILYIVSLLVLSSVYLIKGQSNYLTYKKEIQAVVAKEIEAAKEKEKVKEEEKQVPVEAEVVPVDSTGNETAEETYADVAYSRLLKLGIQGDDVKRIQYLLKKKDIYSGEITGDFDEATKIGVQQFQTANQMLSDGLVGSETWSKLAE